jgi:hypothetical protein
MTITMNHVSFHSSTRVRTIAKAAKCPTRSIAVTTQNRRFRSNFSLWPMKSQNRQIVKPASPHHLINAPWPQRSSTTKAILKDTKATKTQAKNHRSKFLARTRRLAGRRAAEVIEIYTPKQQYGHPMRGGHIV